MRAIALLLGALVHLVAASGVGADPPPTIIRYVHDNIDFKERITITLTPDAATGGLRVRWESGGSVVEKTFEKVVRDEIGKTWGSRAFTITHITGDRDCLMVEQRFVVERGGDRRQVCKNKRSLARLFDLQSTLQLLMRD